jgi:16S rRNA (guanine966-N2)-methyltransferase
VSRKQKTAASSHDSASPENGDRQSEVRIVGGSFRGRRLRYEGDPTVRPMKHRTRESIFNLIGPDVVGRHAVDLFAGTGALGLEALSRGAVSATFIEKHVPSSRIVQENIQTLAVEDRATLAVTSAFLWMKRDLPSAAASAVAPWLVFCSPPYAFFVERQEEMRDLITRIQTHAPGGSILVVESDDQFDFRLLGVEEAATADRWDIRIYAPAVVGIWRG